MTTRDVLTLALEALRMEPSSIRLPWNKLQAITRAKAREEISVVLAKPSAREERDGLLSIVADRLRREISLCGDGNHVPVDCLECRQRQVLIDACGGATPWASRESIEGRIVARGVLAAVDLVGPSPRSGNAS